MVEEAARLGFGCAGHPEVDGMYQTVQTTVARRADATSRYLRRELTPSALTTRCVFDPARLVWHGLGTLPARSRAMIRLPVSTASPTGIRRAPSAR